MTDSPPGSSEYSYSYSYTPSDGDEEELPLMWRQITRIPVDALWKTDDFSYMTKVLDLASRYEFNEHDAHLTDAKLTFIVGSILKLVATKCAEKIRQEQARCTSSESECTLLKDKILLQNKEVTRLRSQLDAALAASSAGNTTALQTIQGDARVADARAENDELQLKLRRTAREIEELKQKVATREDSAHQASEYYTKMQREYSHLVTQFAKEKERHTDLDRLHRKLSEADTQRRHAEDARKKVELELGVLRHEKKRLEESLHKAEDSLQVLKRDTLNDMDRAQSLMRKKDEFWEQKNSQFQERLVELESQKEESQRTIANLERELEDCKADVERLQQAVQTSPRDRRLVKSDSDSESTASTTGTRSGNGAAPQERRVIDRLERENDNLLDAVRKLEAQNASIEDEKSQLRQILNQYEQQDNGLADMRRQLEHLRGVKGTLEQEVTQLKQRLNSATDTLAYTKALEELCRGLGVTKDELNSLRPQNSVAYNEVDTLREEVNVLKEEIEWLEKERRHWMDKVRLQPLMDTKLRLQLGLSSDQLRQLDDLVEQMRLGADVVEDDEATGGNFREKYFQQLEARRRDAEQFNEFVKRRIDEAITQAFQGVVAPEAASAVSALKDHIDVITYSNERPGPEQTARPTFAGVGVGTGVGGPMTSNARQLQSQVHSLTRRVEQSELSLKDSESTIATLKERLAVASAERDLVIKERNQYRDAIFDAAGVASGGAEEVSSDDASVEAPHDKDDGQAGTNVDAAAPLLGMRRVSATKWATISATLREQLASKDALIASFAARMKQSQEDEAAQNRALGEVQDALAAEKREKALLVDQIASLNATNEDSLEQARALRKLNKDLREAAHVDDKELLQKVVLLRRREAHLLQRVRRAQMATVEASDAEKLLRSSMSATLQALKEQLAGSTGYVLPPSTTQHCAEQELLSHLHDTVSGLLTGKLFREDTRFLAQLHRAYLSMESTQDMTAARAACHLKQRELEDLQRQIDALRTSSPPAAGAAAASPTMQTPATPTNPSTRDGQSWETEATTWRQKYTLCAKRYEDKEREVELLERDLDDARAEVLSVREQLRTSDGDAASSSPTPADGLATAASPSTGSSRSPATAAASHVRRLERDVARLKSINLSLIQLSLDLQGRVKALETDVDSRDQEITLIKDSGSSRVVSDFVSAAIREHAALRRQSELALIQVKRLKVQLAASEANYHVVANEATSYKLNAYRLYRRYVDETAVTVDYLRAHQRSVGGAMSARRVEAMATRFRAVAADLAASFRRNKSLAAQLSDETSAVVTLRQQISLLKADSTQERGDLLDTRLKEARTAVRDAARQLTECKEDGKHAESRAARLEAYVKQLDEELTRLEFDTPRITVLSDQLVERLRELKESILQPPETSQQLALALPPPTGNPRLGGGDTSEPDVAVREYKAAVLRQMELTSQCDRLKAELDQRNAECRKHATTISEMQDEVARLESCAAGYQLQVESERKKAETRESRLLLAHDNQVNVSRRATEHNVACLQDLLQKKEAAIKSLEEQLQVERRKYVEHQYEEAARMEKLHETMFRENSAMVERFKEAIEGVSETFSLDGLAVAANLATGGGSAAPEQTVVAQLQALTAETIRLRAELKRARSANIVLETQLAHRINDAQSEAGLGIPTVDQLVSPQLGVAGGPADWRAPPSSAMSPSPPSLSSPSSSADALSGIIQYQNAMIANLRERELSLTEEVQREAAHRAQLEQQLHSVQTRHAEQGGTLDLLTKVTNAASVGDSPLVRELRAQLAAVEQELRVAKEQLAFERQSGKRLQVDAQEWQAHLAALQTEVTAQQVEAERAKQLATLNQNLREDLNAVKEQNDKLVLAASALKHKLLDEVSQGGESTRQRQQEVALAQRMGAIQQESAAHLRVLERRVRAVQKELDTHLEKEKSMLRANEESQRTAYQLHHELRCKDREIAQLQEALTTSRTAAAVLPPGEARRSMVATGPMTAEAGTQVLSTSNSATNGGQSSGRGSAGPASSATAQWDQKENLHHMSTLRGQSARLEKDYRECREQLLSEKETTRALRTQIQALKQQREDVEAAHAQELVRLHQLNRPPTQQRQPLDGGGTRPAATVTSAREDGSSSSLSPLATLEAQNDALRRQLNVAVPVRINELEHRLSRCGDTQRRMAADLAAMQCTTVTEVLQRYESTVGIAKTVEDMESQLLQKNNELLDLRFAKESLQLRVDRLERQLRDGGHAAVSVTTTTTTETRNLETVIENLRVVIERLQVENKSLVAQGIGSQRYQRLLQEVVELRELATALAADNTRLERAASRGRHRTDGTSSDTSDLLRRLTAAQATTRQYEAELQQIQARLHATPTGLREGTFTRTSESRLEDAVQFSSAPPPLPAAPFSQATSVASSASRPGRTSTTSLPSAPQQRRLSANSTSLSTDRHADLPHHRVHSRLHK